MKPQMAMKSYDILRTKTRVQFQNDMISSCVLDTET